MKPIRCIAVDDEPIALRKLEGYICQTPFLELAAACGSPLEAAQVMSAEQVDALFIDINMPDLNGMEFVASLPHAPLVVFTTAYAEYAVESYRLAAVDYLLKPFDFADFQRAAHKLLDRFQVRPEPPVAEGSDACLFVKEGYDYVNVRLSDILYVKGMNEYVQLFTFGTARPVTAYLSMRQLMEQLPAHFLQVHRSYIVNMHHIRRVERFRILIGEDTRIPVGETYQKEFVAYLQAHSLEKRSR